MVLLDRTVVFPYYIVRFKLFLRFLCLLGVYSFHTTQYDLNYLSREFFFRKNISFHTTQYDLNSHHMAEICISRSFPYYIVRFKLAPTHRNFHPLVRFHTTQYDLNLFTLPCEKNIAKFPYYIVRFKLRWKGFNSSIRYRFPYYIVRFKHGFRNLSLICVVMFPYYIVRFKRPYRRRRNISRNGFPYYIVRFKQYKKDFDIPVLSGFHTTQYDLNRQCCLQQTKEHFVSILHSTI